MQTLSAKTFLLFIALQVALTGSLFADEKDIIASFPYHAENNRIGLEVTLNGKTINLLLDSGASTTILFAEAQASFTRLAVQGDAQVTFPAVDKTFNGKRLEPYTLSVSNVPFTVTNSLLIGNKKQLPTQLMRRYDGILGQEFFLAYAIEVNPIDQIITLRQKGSDLSALYRTTHPLVMRGTAPHVRFRSQLPWEDAPSVKEFMIDTGYPGAMVIWSRKHFNKATTQKEFNELKKLNKGIVTNAKFKFGRLKFSNTPVFLGPNSPFQVEKRDGLIGGILLNHFHYAIDLTSQKLWMLSKKDKSSLFRQIYNTVYPPNDEDFIVKTYNDKKDFKIILESDPD